MVEKSKLFGEFPDSFGVYTFYNRKKTKVYRKLNISSKNSP